MRVAHKKDPRFREGFKSLVDSIGFFDPSRMTMKTVTLERSDRIGFMRLLTFERWTFAFAQVQVLGLTLEHGPPAMREAKFRLFLSPKLSFRSRRGNRRGPERLRPAWRCRWKRGSRPRSGDP